MKTIITLFTNSNLVSLVMVQMDQKVYSRLKLQPVTVSKWLRKLRCSQHFTIRNIKGTLAVSLTARVRVRLLGTKMPLLIVCTMEKPYEVLCILKVKMPIIGPNSTLDQAKQVEIHRKIMPSHQFILIRVSQRKLQGP
jgi:hypothetical protein